MTDFDIAIVGSGFAGSLLGMIARKLGYSVLLLEKGEHPRIVVGESSTPLANLLLEELSVRYDLPSLLPFCKWGSWQEHYPNVACGLKRGFTFYHHDLQRPAHLLDCRERQLLVAASPNDAIADTHWYRADFDHFLVREAQNLGVEYLDECDIQSMEYEGSAITLRGLRKGAPVCLRARFLVDATGPRGFIHRALNLEERTFPDYPKTESLSCHFTGVARLTSSDWVNGERTPYPIDDAAVHHVFPGGWIWVLRFNNGVTSAGVAARSDVAKQLALRDGAPAWKRLLSRLPELEEQFSAARPLYEFKRSHSLAFWSEKCAGKRWAMLPSAYGFVDPLLSTGIPLTLFGIDRLGRLLEKHDLDGLQGGLTGYEAESQEDLLAAARMISALYANMENFEAFSAISLLYFAAVSYAETARRLRKPDLQFRFLLRDHATFGPSSRAILESAARGVSPDQTTRLKHLIRETIEPIDVAGLTGLSARNWFPIRASDLRNAAHKVQASEAEIQQLLFRTGFDVT